MNEALVSGEALTGEEPEVAHVDVIIGDRDGPVGNAYAEALGAPSQGHGGLTAIVAPNLQVQPPTVISPTVTIQDLEDGAMIFGPAQKAVADAVADCVEDGTIPDDRIDDICIVANVFVHPAAEDKQEVYDNNLEATTLAIERAVNGEPTADRVAEERNDAEHPYA